MVYSCRSDNCEEEFTTERGLSSHRIKCRHYKIHEAAALAKRKEQTKNLHNRRMETLAKAKAEQERKQKQVVSLLSLPRN